jgi:hypothetical protein
MCELPGWWLLALLVLAPWAYGTTFPQTRDLLAGALIALICLYAMSLLIQRRLPRLHRLAFLFTVIILVQGWVMTLNPKMVYDAAVQYFHFVRTPVPWLPGTVDQETSLHQMWLITGLFGTFWVISDLGCNRVWRNRFWLTISGTGISLAVLGLLQRVTGAPGILWRSDLNSGPTFFATYRYHANAGAFINIGLLLIAARTVCMFRRDHSNFVRSFWMLAFLGTLVSEFVNVSRAATLIGVCLLSVFVYWDFQERLRKNGVRLGVGHLTAIGIAGIVVTGLLVWAFGFSQAYQHWAQLRSSLFGDGDGRFLLYRTVLRYVLPVSGFWGFGPGTFHLIFPFFTVHLGTTLQGYWEYAHEDYLETWVEWGIFGLVVWSFFFGQILVVGAWKFWNWRRKWDGDTRRFALASFLALGAVLIHAAVDFPMQIASLQLYTAVLLGLVAAWSGTGGAARSHRVRKPSQTTAGEHQASQTALP